MKSKYTKKSGNKKNMKMKKTRKERKVKSRNMKSRKMKSQVGGGNGEMDPLLKVAIITKDGNWPIMLYNANKDKYWYLKTRSILQGYIGDQVEEQYKKEYQDLLDVMDTYKKKEFDKLKNKLDLSKIPEEKKKEVTENILRLINPNDLENKISLIKIDPETGEKKRIGVTLQL